MTRPRLQSVAADEAPGAPVAGDPRPTRASETAALVARAAEGDVVAFERLVAPHLGQVYHFAMAFGAGPEEARDLSQEALIRAYRAIGSFRFQAAFSTWLLAIVKHACLDARRGAAARARSLEQPLDDEESSVSEAALAEERLVREDDRRAVWAALRRVPPGYREVVLLLDVEERSYEEIAELLRVPVGTVKSRLSRGREALRAAIFRQRATADRLEKEREEKKR